MQPTLAEVESIARGAGKILLAGYGQRHRVKYKGSIDLVTETDHLSENYILQAIRQHWPEHRIITEESGNLEGRDCCQWFVDPLDGTVNFAHGVPVFSVSIAYAQDGVVRLGAVYEPLRDECFSAERGRGAWLNGDPIHPSQPPDLDHSLLVTGFRYDIRTNPRQQSGLLRQLCAAQPGGTPPRLSRARPVLRGCRSFRWLLGAGGQILGRCRRWVDRRAGRRAHHQRVWRSELSYFPHLHPGCQPVDLWGDGCNLEQTPGVIGKGLSKKNAWTALYQSPS